jgi:dimethylargininase
MVAPLRRVLVCEPQAAGWGDAGRAAAWRRLGYPHPPAAATARAEHRALVARLAEAGAEVVALPPGDGLTPDALYPHDPSLLLDDGALILRMGKAARAGEPDRHRAFYAARGIPIAGRLEEPATAEGGDLLWLDAGTLLAGRGYRTNAAGIEQLRALLAPRGVTVLEAPLPHGQGPGACLHLMSLLSLLDETTALVDLEWLAVPVVEELGRRGLRLIEIDPAERPTQAANVLSLGGGRLLALAENPRTNRRLADHGFTVLTIPGTEIAHNGGGGPTCLTRPLLRR